MKIAFALILTLSAYLVGCGAAERQGEVCDILKDIVRLCEYLEYRMVYTSSSLDEMLRASGTDFGLLAAKEGWNSAAESLPIPKECTSELLLFGKTLGITGFDSQVKAVGGLKEYIEKQYAELKSTLEARQKSTKAVCGLVGALAGILLI